MSAPRPFSELRDTGLLWLINTTVLHPRGYAIALHYENGDAVGWSLLGDGGEPWMYDNAEQESLTARFVAVEALFAATREAGGTP